VSRHTAASTVLVSKLDHKTGIAPVSLIEHRIAQMLNIYFEILSNFFDLTLYFQGSFFVFSILNYGFVWIGDIQLVMTKKVNLTVFNRDFRLLCSININFAKFLTKAKELQKIFERNTDLNLYSEHHACFTYNAKL